MRFVFSLRQCAVVLAIAAIALATGLAAPVAAIVLPTTEATLLAKAVPDECFNGVGVNYPPGPPCASGQPKVNQAYVWGLTRTVGNELWFGTMSNTHCLVEGAYLGQNSPSASASSVCEFGMSQQVRLGTAGPPATPPNTIPAAIGDFRPPHIYAYNLGTQSLVEKTVPAPVQAALNTTIGLRAAGTLNDVVLLAGPSLQSGLNMFAFRASTGTFLGYQYFPVYTNIRKFVVAGGVLYAGVGRKATVPAIPGEKTGRVLRWTGSIAAPFTFVEVGIIDSMASEIAQHEGRLYVTSWPDTELATSGGQQAGLYMSPPIPGYVSPQVPGSGFVGPATDWTKVWTASDYEPDPVTAATYGGGALASFGGYLYWGTMHVPYLSTLAHFGAYQSEAPTDTQGQLTWAVGSERAISIFRGKNFDTAPAMDVVYGSPTMQAYVKTGVNPGSWQTKPNGMGLPLWGGPGFNNPFNNYTWTMAVHDNRLWVGTMDWSWLLTDGFGGSSNLNLPAGFMPASQTLGADLWYFPSANSPAYPESLNGIGNPSSYGIRNMVVGTDLYLGMANPMNLLTNAATGPLGGWELIKIMAKPKNTPAGFLVDVPLDQDARISFCHVETAGNTLSQALPAGALPFTLPPLDNRYVSNVLFVGSTADWRTGCQDAHLAQVYVPMENASSTTRMYQLVWDPVSGGFRWRDITVFAGNGGVTGAIDAQFLGVIVVVGVKVIPTLSAAMQFALMLLLALSGGLMLLRRARKPAA